MAVLLELVQAVEEELLFAGSGSRLDYFKAAIDYEARLRIKKLQLGLSTPGVADGTGAAGGAASAAKLAVSVEDSAVKRERQDGEQHHKENSNDTAQDDMDAADEADNGTTEAAETDSEPFSKKQKS